MNKCMPCVAEYKLNLDDEAAFDPDKANDAITWAPSWQTKTVAGQMMFACAVVPVCADHVAARERSPLEKATEGGLVLGVPDGS